MGIKLSWSDVNAGLIDGIRIYRSNAFIPADALPSPLATLSATTTEYHDTDMSANTIWHYRVGFYNATEELVTDDQLHGYYPDTGPGPQTLKAGTWELGYFGRVDKTALFTVAELIDACGLTGIGTPETETNMSYWHKFIREGKILFFPNTRVIYYISWAMLYQAGLVYGVDGFGAAPVDVTFTPFNVNQLKLITKNTYQFKVRLPKISRLSSDQYMSAATVDGSEWMETIVRSNIGDFNRVATKNRWDDSQIAIRGHMQEFFNTSSIAGGSASSYPDDWTSAGHSSNTGAMSWLPVLELIL